MFDNSMKSQEHLEYVLDKKGDSESKSGITDSELEEIDQRLTSQLQKRDKRVKKGAMKVDAR